MVVFTCSHCGDSVKKNKVEKHYQTVCSRNPVSITCIDCCKDFSSETFAAHTKCVSEEERYAAKGSLPRPNANKGEKKQQAWQEIIESMLESNKTLTSQECSLMKLLVNYENVPRKKPKFQNFLKSCLNNRYNSDVADSVFDKIEDYSKSLRKKSEDEKENVEKTDVTENGDGHNKQEIENDNPNHQEKLSKKERKEKRKKNKSESELKEDESNETLGMEDTKQDRKKKHVAENGDSHNQQEENFDTSNQKEEKLSKKERREKRKREKSESELKEVESNEAVGTENTEQEGKKKRKSKKENSILDVDENKQLEKQQEQGELDENEGTNNVETLTATEEGEEKLSKKERKEKRKKAKYEAELKQIESSHMLEEVEKEDEGKKKKKSKKGLEVEVETADDGNESQRKKHRENKVGAENGLESEDGKSKKKDKKEKTIENGIDNEITGRNKKKKQKSDSNVAENGIAGDDAPVEEGKSKKKRKKGEDAAEDEPSIKIAKESDIEDESAAGKTRFNWQEIIINVLQSKDSKELPLKRLQKKVLAEHEAMGCGSAADVKTIAKFHKKIQKTPGVSVQKDVVRLVMEK